MKVWNKAASFELEPIWQPWEEKGDNYKALKSQFLESKFTTESMQLLGLEIKPKEPIVKLWDLN